MGGFRHFFALTATALRSIPQRLGAALVTVISISTVIGVLVAMLALGQGLESFAQKGVRDEEVIVMANGAQSAMNSTLTVADVAKILEKPGIRRDAQGRPMASGSVTQIVDGVTRKNQHGSIGLFAANTQWREIWPEVQLKTGRFFQPGLHELLVSDVIRARFKDVEVGDVVKVNGSPWKIVGVFKGNGGFFDDALVGDADTLLAAFPQATYSSVAAILETPASFDVLSKAVTSDPTLKAKVMTSSAANEAVIKGLRDVLDFVSYFIGGLMGLGAVCGALSSLYAAVAARTVEIATLRAIGFGAGPIVGSVLAEGLLLAIPPAVIGAAAAWWLFNGNVVDAGGLTFQMSVTPHLLVVSIFWALAIALIGGFLPAIRAATLPVAIALRGS
ncbi:MAG TPA: ABC transporter permease [Steroidobacteraceae bacterium]|jgi:putative ABC transport system permease protein|nr:ABC transporter permease [Steroidobacteraceae bacterium]